MKSTRRDFIRFVVAGSVVAGCPFDLRAAGAAGSAGGAADNAAAAPPELIDGEHNEICHRVRDGHNFPSPPPTRRCDVAIIGGGPSGLASAYFLRGLDFLLLEKELHWGGNAFLESYQGEDFATGAAFDWKGSCSEQLVRHLGLNLLPIDSPDPSIIKGKWIPDTWRTGVEELPYPLAVCQSFKKFRQMVVSLKLERNAKQFDSEPLTKYLAGYAPEITEWWDAFGPSNWGARSADTSALVALTELQDMAGHDPDLRVTLPGGNGAISRKLAEALSASHADRMLAGSTVVRVEQEKSAVRVTYVRKGKNESLEAKIVIMASPKFITSKIVAGIPDHQRDAMDQIHYAPYPVINLIFDRPVYNRGYDTWCPGNTFTDFIVADWTVRNQPGYKPKFNILTLYTPLEESERKKLLTIPGCKLIASSALRDFQRLQPVMDVNPVEVHLYRRGHPMFVASPGTYTQLIPKARVPMDRVCFANTDSEGPESTTEGAVNSAHRAADWVQMRLKGKTSAQAAASIGYSA